MGPGRLLRSAALSALASLPFVACSGEDSGSSGYSGGPVPLSGYAGTAAEVVCDTFAPCCQSAGIPIDGAACRATMKKNLEASLEQADSTKYRYDPDAAGECLGRYHELVGDSCRLEGDISEPCEHVFIGTVAEGQPCSTSMECAIGEGDSVDCDSSSSSEPGVCVVDRRGQSGDPCYWTCISEGSGRICTGSGGTEGPGQSRCFMDDGLYCSDAGTCMAQKDTGAECFQDDECKSGRCDGSTRLCAARAAIGEPCTSTSDCIDTAYCGDANQCAPKQANGAPCTFSSDCVSDSCSDTGQCQPATTTDGAIGLLCVFLVGGFGSTNTAHLQRGLMNHALPPL